MTGDQHEERHGISSVKQEENNDATQSDGGIIPADGDIAAIQTNYT